MSSNALSTDKGFIPVKPLIAQKCGVLWALYEWIFGSRFGMALKLLIALCFKVPTLILCVETADENTGICVIGSPFSRWTWCDVRETDHIWRWNAG